MIRVRFKVAALDHRPVNWPIKHPYWKTGYTSTDDGAEASVLVAYADDEEELLTNWPDAEDVEVLSEHDHYSFSSRFPKPSWLLDNPHTQGN